MMRSGVAPRTTFKEGVSTPHDHHQTGRETMKNKNRLLYVGIIASVLQAMPAAAQERPTGSPQSAASDASAQVQAPLQSNSASSSTTPPAASEPDPGQPADPAASPAEQTGTGAIAADQPATSDKDIVIVGSRIVREGYEAPTPLSVIGEAQLAANANSNIAQAITTLPAFSGSTNTRVSATSGSNGVAGINSLNLRSLGPNRTLVLLDGHRFPPVTASGIVDVNTLPQDLISRVDVVTGGASAVYGSDAVAGVVNFTLDRDLQGIKGEVSGGVTNYGDGGNYRLTLTGGTRFAGGRGRIFLAGEHVHDDGIGRNTGRDWTRAGLQTFVNPAYTPINGLPQRLILDHVGYLTASPGGVIVGGPLANTAFGEGGTPYRQNVGDISSDTFMRGGDWERNDNRRFASIAPSESRQSGFGRVSFDISDDVEIYGQLMYTRDKTQADVGSIYLPGASGPLIQIDNPFIPASVRDAMVAAGVTSIRVGTLNQDLGVSYQRSDRSSLVFAGGLRGNLKPLGDSWRWDLYAQKGITRTEVETVGNISRTRYVRAVDAVRNASGAIVCRITLTDPTEGCAPYNVFGTGVNDPAGGATSYIHVNSMQRGRITQEVYSGSLTGEPFSNWAGPISVALSAEHRRDAARATVDPFSARLDHIYANYSAIDGSNSVTEGALETVVPLIKHSAAIDSWDLNAAARYTSYSLAGSVFTWKVGTTFSPIPDLKVRFTRSRDIRAPNIQETFSPANVQRNTAFDPFTNSTPVFDQTTIGNINLRPEKADTLGLGMVIQPSFIPGLTASVDVWDIKINQAISSVTPANVLLLCFDGSRPDLCSNITRTNGVVTSVISQNINFAQQNVRGLDFEASYRFDLAAISASLPGRLSIHGNATHYLKNFIDSRVSPAQDFVGENSGLNPPNWRYTVVAGYSLDKLDVAFTMRGFSSGTQFANYIECASACPRTTTANPTVNNNYLAGRTYLDASIKYDFNVMGAKISAFANIRNIFDSDPALSAASINFSNGSNPALYDVDGRVYRAGLRFRL